MPVAEYLSLLLLATAVSFTPGPNTTLSATLAANLGLRSAMPFVLAVPVGWALLLSLCAAGLGAMLLAVPALRGALQAAGIGYLGWLAWRLWNASLPTSNAALAEAHGLQVAPVGFWQGVGLQFVNIKAWTLALAIVSGWLAGQADAVLRFAVVLPTLMAYALCSNLLYAWMGSALRQWLAGPWMNGQPSGRRLRVFNRSMAALLVLTALGMLRL